MPHKTNIAHLIWVGCEIVALLKERLMQRDYYTCYRSQRDMALNSFHVVILVYMAIVLISLGK